MRADLALPVGVADAGGEILEKAPEDHIEIDLRVLSKRARLQAANDGQPAEVTLVQPALTTQSWLARDRNVEVIGPAGDQALKSAWEDAHDREEDGIDFQRLADDSGISSELALPQSVADDGDRGTFRAAGPAVVRREKTSDDRRHAKHIEKAFRDEAADRLARRLADGSLDGPR